MAFYRGQNSLMVVGGTSHWCCIYALRYFQDWGTLHRLGLHADRIRGDAYIHMQDAHLGKATRIPQYAALD